MYIADAYNQCVRRMTVMALNEHAETIEELVQVNKKGVYPQVYLLYSHESTNTDT